MQDQRLSGVRSCPDHRNAGTVRVLKVALPASPRP
jgi:hypothetical protein